MSIALPSLYFISHPSHEFLEVLDAMFAEWTHKIVRQEVAFVDIATNLALPAAFAVFGLLGLRLRLGLDVLLIVIVSQRRLVGKHLGIQHIGDEHGVSAEIDTLVDTTSQICIGILRNVKHMVHGAVFRLAVGELVHLAPTLEPEMLKDLHRGLGGQHRNVKHARILDEVMRVVALVDRHSDLQGIAGDLRHRVHDAAVVNVVVVGSQDIESVTYVE